MNNILNIIIILLYLIISSSSGRICVIRDQNFVHSNSIDQSGLGMFCAGTCTPYCESQGLKYYPSIIKCLKIPAPPYGLGRAITCDCYTSCIPLQKKN